MAWRQVIFNRRAVSISSRPDIAPAFSRFFSKSAPYIGRGVETHVAKIETEIGDFQKLLVTRTLKLKKLGIPCKHRKLILKYTHKYRLGLWRPRAEPVKS
ncbi:hypothetical protein L1049_019323 [Liquidambar formosana]|uniref:Small ribosomal subunit protein mS41 SAM domain-containing protein n=1 Tax=Liquidambar formosana TaxID=63359 RepID=A0AAP0SB79_LIQFO